MLKCQELNTKGNQSTRLQEMGGGKYLAQESGELQTPDRFLCWPLKCDYMKMSKKFRETSLE